MKISNKLTDEKLASLIENSYGKEDIDFSDLSSFEAFSVVENALSLMNEEVFADSEFSFDVSNFGYEPLAMCGFLGDESEVDPDIDLDMDDIDMDNNDDMAQ